jgi:protein-S-isoprenylcysteine O-methyltransferase Ste14
MTAPDSPSTQQSSRLTRLGGWLFAYRTSLPIPLAIALLLLPPAKRPTPLWLGPGIVAGGEAIRLWAVHHIGVISRTRSHRLGPLVTTGPFALVRNPLYLGNITLWVGFAVTANVLWMAPVIVALLGFEYHAIVRWEEQLLESRRGDEYRTYAAGVLRWMPRPSRAALAYPPNASWGATLFSERGTLIAIALGFLLLWVKARLTSL